MPPLSLSGFSPATQIGTILYKIIRRSRGETIGTRIDRDIPLIMPPSFVRRLRNNTTQSLVLRTQGLPHGKNKRTSACISKMKAKFLSCGKRSTKNQGEQLQLVVVEAKGACVRRKLGAPFSRRLAARVPSSKLHIALISALQIGQH